MAAPDKPAQEKMRPAQPCSHEWLLANLSYDAATGEFAWKTVRRGVRGKTAQGRAGYQSITINYRSFGAHRIAWFYVTGEWPTLQIDHVNGDIQDNRFANLRPATNGQNKANSRRPRNNSSGVKGVAFNKGARRWMGYYRAGGKQVIREFATFEEAVKFRQEAVRAAHGEFFNPG